MRFFSNLPDDEHVPYKFIEAEPHIKTVVKFMRNSDYAVCGLIGTAFPTAFLLWERRTPSVHPKLLPKLMLIQVPFFFGCGFYFALQRSYFRFWGWSENAREVEMWNKEPKKEQEKKPWEVTDW